MMNTAYDFQEFEIGLRTLVDQMAVDDVFAREVYASLCNMRWQREGMEEPVSMSWRAAGGLVADLVGRGEWYLDYYCSGNEGVVSERVREALGGLGWIPVPWPVRDAGSAVGEGASSRPV
jgi:hypothetical protein